MEDFLIYEVQKGETLEAIGEKFSASAAEIRDFHNRNCHSAGLLWFNTLTGVHRIIVPTKFKKEQSLSVEKAIYLPEFSAHFFTSKYQVTETFSQNDEADFEISYDIRLNITEDKKDIGKIFRVEFWQENFKKNGEKPDSKISLLGLDCMKAVYPLELELDAKGSLQRISNFEELSKRFSRKEADLRAFHTGAVADAYVESFKDHLQNQESSFKNVKSGLLYQMLFMGADFIKKQKVTRSFYLQKNSFPVACEFNADYQFDNAETAAIHFTGKAVDSCSLHDVLRGMRSEGGVDPLDSEISINYQISKSKKNLTSAEAKILLKLDGEDFSNHKLKIQSYE